MHKKIFLIFLGFILSISAFAQEQLVFAIDLVRHGDRTPLTQSEAMQSIWPEAPGQLTPVGMHQAFELGQKLRQYYVDQRHLLPKQYVSFKLKVRSSAYDRTLMTAQSILMGLYPPGSGPVLLDGHYALPHGAQPIPIQTVPRAQDNLLVTHWERYLNQPCYEQYIQSHPEWIARERQYKPYFELWSQIFHLPIQSLVDLLKVSDKLYIEQLYHLPKPEGLSSKMVKTIIELGDWTHVFLMNQPDLAEKEGLEFTNEVYQLMSDAAQHYPQQAQVYQLFVAHDSTIGPQLKILGHQLTRNPPYVARLSFQLFVDDEDTFYIKVFFQDKPIQVDFCANTSCTLAEFKHFLAKKSPINRA